MLVDSLRRLRLSAVAAIDNSNWAVGTFFEGVIASGFASDATDAAVLAEIYLWNVCSCH